MMRVSRSRVRARLEMIRMQNVVRLVSGPSGREISLFAPEAHALDGFKLCVSRPPLRYDAFSLDLYDLVSCGG